MAGFNVDDRGNTYVVKSVGENLDYQFDWSAQLVSYADTIASVAWTVEADLTMGATFHTTTTATIWVSGGTLNHNYAVRCTITTTGNRILERVFRVVIQDVA